MTQKTEPKYLALTALIAVLQCSTCSALAQTASDLQNAQTNYQRNPSDKNAAVNLGKSYLAAQKPAEACKVLESASEAAPQDANLHYLYGESLFRNDKLKEAAFELKRAFNLDSSKGQYAVRAGEALLGAERFDELGEWCSQAMQKTTDETSRSTLQWLAGMAVSRKTKIPKPKLDPRWSEGAGGEK